MKYRVTYKRLSNVAVGGPQSPNGMTMMIVDDCIDADNFDIANDGTTVFYHNRREGALSERVNFMAIPPGFCSLIEPYDRQFDSPKEKSLIVS